MLDRLQNADRLRGFSDGMFSVIITIMVLDLRPPHSAEPAALLEQWPTFLAYALSFLQAGTYWGNHTTLFKDVEHVDARVLWLNLLMLFALSLMPFATAYMGDHFPAPFPVALYAFVLLLPALTWDQLHRAIIAINPREAGVTEAALLKGWIALGLYVLAIPAAYVTPIISLILIFAVAVMYFLPTRFS